MVHFLYLIGWFLGDKILQETNTKKQVIQRKWSQKATVQCDLFTKAKLLQTLMEICICPQHHLNVIIIEEHTILLSYSQSLLCQCNSTSTINDLYLSSSISFTCQWQLLKSIHIFNHSPAQSGVRSFFIHCSKACVCKPAVYSWWITLGSLNLVDKSGKTQRRLCYKITALLPPNLTRLCL